MIVKPSGCCNDWRNVGKVFTVAALGVPPDWCSGCLAVVEDKRGAKLAEWKGPYAITGWILASRLKKIPPISELEGARDALSERTPTKEKA
jgi:hypothetical protein